MYYNRVRIDRSSASRGSRALSEELRHRGVNSRLLHMQNSVYRQQASDLVINWGVTNKDRGINKNAHLACNKLRALCLMSLKDIPLPPFTTNIEKAWEWAEKGHTVVCRTTLRGSGGVGIVLATTKEEVVDAPLYTKYVKKTQEYRVHVFDGEIIDAQRKARDRSVPDDDVNWQIRNHSNGFVFVREGVNILDSVSDMCKQAIIALGLTFGAVDLIYNEHYNKWYVLEVNTAPGLEGITLDSYTNAIIKYMENS